MTCFWTNVVNASACGVEPAPQGFRDFATALEPAFYIGLDGMSPSFPGAPTSQNFTSQDFVVFDGNNLGSYTASAYNFPETGLPTQCYVGTGPAGQAVIWNNDDYSYQLRLAFDYKLVAQLFATGLTFVMVNRLADSSIAAESISAVNQSVELTLNLWTGAYAPTTVAMSINDADGSYPDVYASGTSFCYDADTNFAGSSRQQLLSNYAYDGGWVTNPPSFVADQDWHVTAFVIEYVPGAFRIRTFVDGVFQAELLLDAHPEEIMDISPGDPDYLTRSMVVDYYIYQSGGSLDEFVLYQRALSPYELSLLQVQTSLPTRPSNDMFSAATLLTGTYGSTSGSVTNATLEVGEPYGDDSENSYRNSVWYKWTAPSSGSFTFSTEGSSLDTHMAIFTGSAVNALTEVAMDNDSGAGYTSIVTFSATGGVMYYVRISTYWGEAGPFVLTWGAD